MVKSVVVLELAVSTYLMVMAVVTIPFWRGKEKMAPLVILSCQILNVLLYFLPHIRKGPSVARY